MSKSTPAVCRGFSCRLRGLGRWSDEVIGSDAAGLTAILVSLTLCKQPADTIEQGMEGHGAVGLAGIELVCDGQWLSSLSLQALRSFPGGIHHASGLHHCLALRIGR